MMTGVSGWVGRKGRTLAVARQDGDRDSPEIEAVIEHVRGLEGERESERLGLEDSGQGLCHALGNSVRPQNTTSTTRRDKNKKRAEGRMASIGCCSMTRRRENEMTRAGVHLTATVRNGDIDQRNAFRHLGLTGVTCTVGLWNPRCFRERM